MDTGQFSRMSSYVEQTDIHSPMATVREALQFSASLRLDRSVPDSEKQSEVDAVMSLLELGPIGDKLIGVKADRLSVEQAKRVTIGVSLVANPSILFLDEPTSGLDSRAASVVMRAIRNIADTGRTVLCTIHQPSKALFSKFDSLLLLKKGCLCPSHFALPQCRLCRAVTTGPLDWLSQAVEVDLWCCQWRRVCSRRGL